MTVYRDPSCQIQLIEVVEVKLQNTLETKTGFQSEVPPVIPSRNRPSIFFLSPAVTYWSFFNGAASFRKG